jgi:hypothetical protein
MDLPVDAGAGMCTMATRHSALTTKVPASTANAVEVPPAATIIPPIAGPRNDAPMV